MKEDFNPLILNKWLNGEAREEDLKEWLMEIYPDNMQNDIMEVFEGQDVKIEEDIDSILEEMTSDDIENDVSDINNSHGPENSPDS